MKFLDADVKKPLGAVSAIVDEGNTVVFSRKRSYIQNDATGEKIQIHRSGGTFVIKLDMIKGNEAKKANKARNYADMEIFAEDEVPDAEDDQPKVVFTRREV